VIQSAAGLHQGADQTLAAAFALRDQLTRLDLDARLARETVAWALVVWARVALAESDPPAANARADAAVAVGVSEGFLAVDVDRVAADARWAAGLPEPSVEYGLRAVERYEALALDQFQQSARLSPQLLDRLSEPMFGTYTEAADRLVAIGAPGLGLTLRRRLVDLLGALAVRSPDVPTVLMTALSDLAEDLRSTGRPAEARDVAELADSIAVDAESVQASGRVRVRLGSPVSWSPLAPNAAFGITSGSQGEPSGRLAALRGPADAEEQQRRLAAEAELAHRADQQAARATLLAAEEQRQHAEQQRLAEIEAGAERRAAEEAARAAERARLEKQRRRAERMAEHQRQLEREQAEREAALRAQVSGETAEERAEREELEHLAAELAALEAEEAAQAQREADELAELERGSDEEAAAEAEGAEQQRLLVEQAEVERLASEQADLERPAELEAAEQRLAADEAEAQLLAAGLAEAERAEQERAARAENARVAAEQAEEERLATEQAERERAAEQAEREQAAEQAEREQAAQAERERAEANLQRVAAEEAEQERLALEAAELERVGVEQAEEDLREAEAADSSEQAVAPVEPVVAPDQSSLERARADLAQALASGSKKDVRDAGEQLVDALRVRYEAEPEVHLAEFLEALDQLATARWQAGDWWGSRAPSKEAKALRKLHGR